MSDNFKYSFFALTMILLISSCNEYQKVLNNEDMNVKYKAAE
jgi:hypothetical protein